MSELELRKIDYAPAPDGYVAIASEVTGLEPSGVDPEQLFEKYEEGNETYEIITGEDGRQYETLVFNTGQPASILKPSTSFSSALKNPGNVVEAALAAIANPGASYRYMASFGNHPTGHMSPANLRYVRRTGRYTLGNGKSMRPYRPLRSVQDMADAIESHYGAPSHVTADAEGGRLALGLMAAFPKHTVGQAFLNGLDGISHGAYVAPKLGEDLRSRVRRRGIADEDAQPGELTPLHLKEVKQRMPAIYHGLGLIAHIAPLPVLLYPRDVRDKLAMTIGFRGHDDLDDLESHAVFQDMEAALRQQAATVTLQFNKESAIHVQDDCVRFGKLVMDRLPPTLLHRRVRLIVGEGTLDYQTDAPQDRTRVERYAFPDIDGPAAL